MQARRCRSQKSSSSAQPYRPPQSSSSGREVYRPPTSSSSFESRFASRGSASSVGGGDDKFASLRSSGPAGSRAFGNETSKAFGRPANSSVFSEAFGNRQSRFNSSTPAFPGSRPAAFGGIGSGAQESTGPKTMSASQVHKANSSTSHAAAAADAASAQPSAAQVASHIGEDPELVMVSGVLECVYVTLYAQVVPINRGPLESVQCTGERRSKDVWAQPRLVPMAVPN